MNIRFLWSSLVIIILLPCFISSCSGDSDDNDVPTQEQTKLVKIEIYEHEKKFGQISEYGQEYEVYDYNSQGLLVHKSTCQYFNSTIGRIKTDYYYEYDSKGRMTVQKEKGITSYTYHYTYNEMDSVSTIIQYDKDGAELEVDKYEYADDRKLKRVTRRIAYLSNNFGYVDDYSYYGNTVKYVTTMLEDGTLFGTIIREFDNYNNLLKETYIDKNGKSYIQKLFSYEYNALGQITKRTSNDNMYSDDKTYEVYSYNLDGTINTIQISHSNRNDESELRYKYTYK